MREIRKELNLLSWEVSEEEYRRLKSISYSTISTYSREGFKGLKYLGVSKDSPSLRYGSLVDTLLTDKDNLKEKFKIINFKVPGDQILKILNLIAENTKYSINDLNQIDKETLMYCIKEIGYGADNWKDQTKIDKVINEGNQYFHLLVTNNNKVIISDNDLQYAKSNVKSLQTNDYCKYLFGKNIPENCETYFQLKFKHHFDGIDLKCMFDIIHVDHENKIIYPIDLKTTSKDENDFESSFLTWRYDIQATMYSFILREIIKNDDYYKFFTVAPFKFLVINKYINIPLFWEYNSSIVMEQENIIYQDKTLVPWYKMIHNIDRHLKEQQFTYSYDAINGIRNINVKYDR